MISLLAAGCGPYLERERCEAEKRRDYARFYLSVNVLARQRRGRSTRFEPRSGRSRGWGRRETFRKDWGPRSGPPWRNVPGELRVIYDRRRRRARPTAPAGEREESRGGPAARESPRA